MIRVISWNQGEAARQLSQAVSNGKLLRNTTDSSIPRTDTLINLGLTNINREIPEPTVILNKPSDVRNASNKLSCLNALGSLGVPYFTDKSLAIYEAIRQNAGLVIRHTLNGHGGEGIQIITAEEMQSVTDIPDAPLYTLLIKKRREYRVHAARLSNGNIVILDLTRKIHRDGLPIAERGHVWNYNNGYIFTRESVEEDRNTSLMTRIVTKARESLMRLNLDFAAFDIVVAKGGRLDDAGVYVLEANTSPGMQGTTLDRYVEYFNVRDKGGNLRPFFLTLRDVEQGEPIVNEE